MLSPLGSLDRLQHAINLPICLHFIFFTAYRVPRPFELLEKQDIHWICDSYTLASFSYSAFSFFSIFAQRSRISQDACITVVNEINSQTHQLRALFGK